jgi:Fe(3+) dicitrate transport protein
MAKSSRNPCFPQPTFALSALALALSQALATLAWAAETPATLDQIDVLGARDLSATAPEVVDAKVRAGKKITVVDLASQPAIPNGNPRAVFAQAPGLFISDQYGAGQWNIGYRGLGDPHESEFVTATMDGVPIMSDWMTYNTLLWAPQLQRMDGFEVIRGGSALMYGPQPGPVINFLSRRPSLNKDLNGRINLTAGRYGLRGFYGEAGFGGENSAYLFSAEHRENDGQRPRGGSRVKSVMLSGLLQDGADGTWNFDINGFQSFNQEAGRLSFAQWQANPNAGIRPFDDFRVQRLTGTLSYDRDLSERSNVHVKTWLGYHDRFSRRAGTVLPGQPLPAFTTFDRQQFQFAGLDARFSTLFDAHTFTAGVVAYGSDSPRSQGRAADVLAAEQTTLRFKQERDSRYSSLFAEGVLRFGAWNIVPGVRFDRFELDVNETLRFASLRRPAIDRSFDRNVPLFGLGVTHTMGETSQLYFNASEGYRPMRFDDVANPTAETIVANDPDVSDSQSYELGWRGTAMSSLAFDVSLFRIDFENKIEQRIVGVSDIERVNSGDARHQGVDLSLQYDFFKSADNASSLLGFVSNTWLDAEIVRSLDPALVGKTPQFAPDNLTRLGLIYSSASAFKVSLTGTLVSEQFWQDSNLARGTGASFLPAKIPSYQVFDLAVEYPVNDMWTLSAGVDNLTDKTYFSRIRTDGIEPAPNRMSYFGVSAKF